ncbi:MAG: pirin family protein [Thermoplasmata archaeon]|nr:pirin family protein [Thermoplasmata archaeon]
MGLFGRKVHGAIMRVQEASYNWDCDDPFFFAVYHRDNYPKGNEIQAPPLEEIQARTTMGNDYAKFLGYRMYKGTVSPGFPLHSHWGYETINYVAEGYVDTFDSMGNQSRYGFGDLQWITASSRYGHCEMYPLAYTDRDNIQVVTQISLNLPLGSKNKANQVRTVWEHDIPKVSGEGWVATVIAGEFAGCKGVAPNNLSWAADPSHHVSIVRIVMEKGCELKLEPTEAATRNLYITEGDAVIEGKEIHKLSRVKLDPKMEATVVMGDTTSDVWLLEGDPIGEKQRNYGPIMLGSDSEVRAALNEVREKQETDWPWKFVNQKQPLGTHRFFRDSEGNETRPDRPAPGEHELPPPAQE